MKLTKTKMANGFTKKSVGTLSLGEKLRKIREDRRISLNEVSRATKIQIKYLESLEQGEYDELPVDVYARGFLRSYGDFLGIDEAVLLKLYEKEKGIKRNLDGEKNSKIKLRKPPSISYFVLTPKKIIFSIAAILVLAGLFFIYKEIGSYASAPRLAILSPNSNDETSENFIFIEGITDKDAAVFINNQPALVNDDGKFKEKITLQSGVNSINIKAVNKFQKEADETILVRSSAAENINPNENENNPSGQEAFNDKLGMEIRVDPGPVWLSVEADDNLVFSGNMLTGAAQSFEAKDKITVSSGKGNATFVKFNGKDIGALSSEPGAVKNMVFDKNTK